MYLSRMQKKVLRYIQKNEYVIETELPFDYDRIIDLVEKKFVIEYVQCPAGKEGNLYELHGYKLSPSGEAALAENRNEHIHRWINTGLSVIAIVITLLQLLL